MAEGLPPVVARYFEAANRHDVEAMAACWRAGGTEVIPALGLELTAPDGLSAHFEGLFESIPDVTFEIREHVGDASLVAVRSVMAGHHRGHYNGLAGTGRHFEVDATDFIRLEGDEIVHNHVTVDALTTLRQVGVLPPAGSRSDMALLAAFNAFAGLKRLVLGRSTPR